MDGYKWRLCTSECEYFDYANETNYCKKFGKITREDSSCYDAIHLEGHEIHEQMLKHEREVIRAMRDTQSEAVSTDRTQLNPADYIEVEATEKIVTGGCKKIDITPSHTSHLFDPIHIPSDAKDIPIDLVKGLKYDQGKLAWELLPLHLVEECVSVLTFGAKKYGPNNWQQVENAEERYYAALMRHIVAWRNGEEADPESGISHLAHAMCNLVFLDWLHDKD